MVEFGLFFLGKCVIGYGDGWYDECWLFFRLMLFDNGDDSIVGDYGIDIVMLFLDSDRENLFFWFLNLVYERIIGES